MRLSTILSIVFIVITVQSANSQTSIGFKNPENTKPLLDYRLPTWGYRTLTFDFSFSGSRDYQEFNNGLQKSNKSMSLALHFNPAYVFYYESEKNISNINIRISGSNNHINEKNDYKNRTHEYKYDYMIAIYSASFQTKHYITNQSFFSISGESSGDYRERDSETINSGNDIQNTSEWSGYLNRNYNSDVKMGFGFGRVRNVAPVIRALRLNERLAAVEKDRTINADEVQEIARTIAKNSGYQSVYQRESKYFWNDVFKPIAKLDPLTPFEVLYFSEIISETIGSRYEGWDAAAGLDFIYDYYKESEKCEKMLGAFTQARFFHNISLSKQISLKATFEWYKPLINKENFPATMNIDLNCNYLWCLADRVLWNSSITFKYCNEKNSEISPESKLIFTNTLFQTSLSYFIEDNLSFSTSINWNLNYYDQTSNTSNKYISRLSSNMGLTYYFDRTLF